MDQQVLSAMKSAGYVALVRIKSTKPASITFEEYLSVWNPDTQQSESQTRMVTHSLLVSEFEPIRVFKGPKSVTRVETAATADACGVTFERGATYLLYANEHEEPGKVSTSQCMRTAPESGTVEDIEILTAAASPRSISFQPTRQDPKFARALDLIHAYAGCGDGRWQDPKFVEGLAEAMNIADELAASDPLSGYSQALRAELVSIWELGESGKPVEAQQEVLTLTDEVLLLKPTLPHTFVAKARVYAKSARIKEAEEEVQKALRMDPGLDSAMLAQADIYRLANNSAKAAEWIRNYIEATPRPVQKASGYEWVGRMYRDIAYHPQAFNREANLQLAKASYYMSVRLDPKDPWRLIGFATFLNEYVADFAGAEQYARQALELGVLPAAQRQLAAARFQALQARAEGMDVDSLRAAIAEIGTTTGTPLEELAKSNQIRDVVKVRLMRLQRSAS